MAAHDARQQLRLRARLEHDAVHPAWFGFGLGFGFGFGSELGFGLGVRVSASARLNPG